MCTGHPVAPAVERIPRVGCCFAPPAAEHIPRRYDEQPEKEAEYYRTLDERDEPGVHFMT